MWSIIELGGRGHGTRQPPALARVYRDDNIYSSRSTLPLVHMLLDLRMASNGTAQLAASYCEEGRQYLGNL